MIRRPASPSEVVNQVSAIHCSFAITGTCTEESIQNNWNKLMKNYPYCMDYEWHSGTFDWENKVLFVSLPEEAKTSINTALRLILEECYFEAIETRAMGKDKSALLVCSSMTIEEKEYTLFGMYQCHSKTDFKSVVYLTEEFLNYFDEIYVGKVLPMGSYYKDIVERRCSPSKERSLELENEKPRDVVLFNCTRLKGEEPKYREKRDGLYAQTCGCIKLTEEETSRFIKWCKSHNFSTQAVFWSIQLKVYNKLFDKQREDAKHIVLMSPFDCRNVLGINTPIIGMFIDAMFPTFPADFLDSSIEEMASRLSTYIRSLDKLEHPEFDRFRDFCYNGNKQSIAFPHTAFFSNIAGMKVMERLTSTMKERFVDFYLSRFVRRPFADETVAFSMYSYGFFDGTCDLIALYNGKVYPEVAERVLNEMKMIINNLQ